MFLKYKCGHAMYTRTLDSVRHRKCVSCIDVQIKLYFKCKEFHNSFKKGTVVEYEPYELDNLKQVIFSRV